MKKYYILIFLYKILYTYNNNNLVKTIFKPLSQSMHLQTQYHKPMYDPDSIFNANFQINCYYQATRESDYMAEHLFQFNPLLFQGEILLDKDKGRDEKALVAPYFGLKTNANLSLELIPHIQNTVIDIQLNLESEKYWLQTNFPIVRSTWKLNKDDQLRIGGYYGDVPLQDKGNIMIAGIPYMPPSLNQDPALIPYNISLDGKNFIVVPNSANDLIQDIFGYGNIDTDYDDDNYDIAINPLSNNYLGIGFFEKLSFYLADISGIYSDPSGSNFTGNFKIENQNLISLSSQLNNLLFSNQSDIPSDKTKTFTNSMLIINQPEVSGSNSLEDALGGYTFGDLKERKYGLFNFSNTDLQQTSGLSDINFQCGYDFIKNKKGHMGVYFKIIIPTGNYIGKEFNNFIFNPIIGNGGHLECGVGVNTHYMFNEKKYNSSYIHLDGYMTHVLSKKQFRIFDKNNLPMSRYALIKELRYDQTANISFDDIYGYNNILKVLGDVNSDWIDVSIDLKGEFLCDIIHKYKNWEIGAGYCFAGQTRENGKYKKTDNSSIENKFSQGNIVYGFKGGTGVDTIIFKTYNDDLNVFKYDYKGIFGSFIQGKTNADVAIDGNSGAYKYGIGTSDGDYSIGTNLKDTFVLPDISSNNRSGLMEAQILHKIFLHLNYIWSNIQWAPKMGLFGSYGFSPVEYKTADYWDIGINFGFIF